MEMDNADSLYEMGRKRRHNDHVSKADEERMSQGDNISPREGFGVGGAVLGSIAAPYIKKIPYVGGALSSVAPIAGGFLPFKKGETVSRKRNK